ncbi:MAG TPA: inorganic phosphate transporter [Aggregatilineaceae bacterium]|nr:inorganic phosphate transporter [Aggregatilineaceae bacterium]
MTLEAGFVVLSALTFGFLNGRTAAANILATVISTHALSLRKAVWMTAAATMISPFLLGLAVASTIGRGVIAEYAITSPIIYAGLLAAITWIGITSLLGIPNSTTHALIGGLVGATWAGAGLDAILADGLLKIGLTLFVSPFVGLIAGFYMVKLCYFLARGASPRINNWFRRGQVITAFLLAVTQANNDVQKTIGIIMLGLIAAGSIKEFEVPLWVMLATAGATALGSLLGGRRIIRTLGAKFFRVRPVHGFGSQLASSVVLLAVGLLGGPVSPTHVMSSSIIGAGSADRVQMVRWEAVTRIVLSWLITIPAVVMIGAGYYGIMGMFW